MINTYKVVLDTIYRLSMTSHTFIKIKRPVKPVLTPQLPEAAIPAEEEPTQPLEIEQPEQPAPPLRLESLAETAPDESMFGTGWSMTELLNEFSGKYNG